MIVKKKKASAKKVGGFALKQTPLIPFTPLIGKQVTEPCLEENIWHRINEALVSYTHPARWEKWGVGQIRPNGIAILLTGPAGCGKTTIARWMAKKVSGAIIEITMADVGGGDPGDTERNTKAIFDYGKENNNCTIFIDECDSLLWSREKAGPDSMWMLAVVNRFLTEIERYKGLVILATNLKHFLDPALKRRLLDEIEIDIPPYETRKELWQEKIPVRFPYQPTTKDLHALATIRITGAEIENAIIREARQALREGRNPTFDGLRFMSINYEKESGRSAR